MSPGARPSAVVRLRRALLVVLVLSIGGLVALYLVGRRSATQLRAPGPGGEEKPSGEVVLKGEGFDYVVSQGEKRLFRIQGDRIVSNREQDYVLEGVGLTFFRDDGSSLEVHSRTGSYSMETQEAELHGKVHLEGPGGMVLDTRGLLLKNKGRLVVSTDPVTFWVAGAWRGRSRQLRANLPQNLFFLAGKVRVTSAPGRHPASSLGAERVAFDRDRHLIRADGGVVLTRDEDRLEATQLSAYLTPDESRVRFVRGRFGVSASRRSWASDGRERETQVGGSSLAVLFVEGSSDIAQLGVDSEGGGRVQLSWTDASGLARRMTTPHLEADFAAGALARVVASAPTVLTESPTAAEGVLLRRLCGTTSILQPGANGELDQLEIEGLVDYQEPGLQATGTSATYRMEGGTMRLDGDPATLTSRRGEVLAPKVAWANGIVHATGGVRLVMPRRGLGSLAGAPLASTAEEPVRAQAKEVTWRQAPQGFLLTGGVKAWQGDNLLLADEVRGDPAADRLVASGSVRTVWTMAERAAGGEGRAEAPLEVRSQSLEARPDEHLLIYTGAPRARQGSRTLACARMDVRSAADGGLTGIECRRQVRIEDPETGRTVRGDDAVYDPDSGTIRVTGSPVVMVDKEGTRIEGGILTYDFRTGAARVESATAPATAAETTE